MNSLVLGNEPVALFNGTDLTGWSGDQYQVTDGILIAQGKNLITEKQFSNYILEFDFLLPAGGNNGIAIHYPGTGRPSGTGMELQILDNTHPKYAKLKASQYHGSLYKIKAAKRGFLKPVGHWNHQKVSVNGPHIIVELNGTIILDANLEELAKKNPKHRGLKRRSGHICFCGHGSPVQFKNITIDEFPDPNKAKRSLSNINVAKDSRKSHANYNVLLIISDDLTANALGCYGNKVCQTPNIDDLATKGTRFNRAYCQATVCGPSRASMLFGYYPYATKATGNTSGRNEIGQDKDSWPQHFRKQGYHTARISKVFHMGVPTDIAPGKDGADDPASWDEAFNSPGPESKTPGTGETLQNNPGGLKQGAAGGNRFSVVEADGDDLVHSDGKTAQKAIELIQKYKTIDKPFFLAVGFVRPHVPLVAPRKYFEPYDTDAMVLPPKIQGDSDDIPKTPGNRRTSASLQLDIQQQKKLIRAYYASVSFIDAMTGKLLSALDESGQRDRTIIIFTSDHGYHLGEHDLWSKVSIHEESARVPLIVIVPGKQPAVCNSLVELLDLYPTISNLCGIRPSSKLQGKNIAAMLDDPTVKVRDAILCSGKGRLYRDERWALLDYGKTGELFDMKKDPQQYTNLFNNPKHTEILATLKQKLQSKLSQITLNKTTTRELERESR
ncbi:MAG: sulfatase-like hydrolase/transferase [Rubripirellula sp.]